MNATAETRRLRNLLFYAEGALDPADLPDDVEAVPVHGPPGEWVATVADADLQRMVELALIHDNELLARHLLSHAGLL